MDTNELSQIYTLLDTLPNPATLNELAYDEEGVAYDKIVYVNKNFLKTIGYTTEDIPDDRTWFIKAYPDPQYREYIMNEWFKAVDKAKVQESDLVGFPAKVFCKDHTERWFNVTTQLSHTIHGKYRTIILVQTESPDEIKLKLDEKSLHLLNEKRLLKTIIDTAPVRIFWKDQNGVYLGCNQEYLHDKGLVNESEVIGKSDYEINPLESAEHYREDDQHVIATGIPKLNYLQTFTQKNGKRLILSTSKVPLADPSGKTIGILGVYQDVTDEYETREALQEKEKLLLVQSRQAAMGEMLSMIAHQWRQPLSSISAVVTNMLVQEAMGKHSSEELNKQLDMITSQVQFLSRTITDFRNFFRPDKEMQKVHPKELVDHALLMMGKLLEDNKIQLRLSVRSDTPFYTYTNEIQHVFINIIKNASDALIENTKEAKWIDLSCSEDDQHLLFEISDNGGGIDAGLTDRIFEPYFSTKLQKNGTGLGLYISKIIVEKHLGGTLSCTNRDEGAVFTIKIPLNFEE